jgi:hypothetical protein
MGHDDAKPLSDGGDRDAGAQTTGEAEALSDAGSVRGTAWPTPAALELQAEAGIGTFLADGTPVPPLPIGAPRQARFGVVLVTYLGCQPAPNAGKPANRPRADARALAERLLATAKDDFHAAVAQGDPGSADDLGTVRQSILEPAPEYVLFTLPVGGVGGPVDTPRGYWVVKRLE